MRYVELPLPNLLTLTPYAKVKSSFYGHSEKSTVFLLLQNSVKALDVFRQWIPDRNMKMGDEKLEWQKSYPGEKRL